jgi:hypothetical protein
VDNRNDLARREARVREVTARRRADSGREQDDAPTRREPELSEAPDTRRVQEEQRLRARADQEAERDRGGDADR